MSVSDRRRTRSSRPEDTELQEHTRHRDLNDMREEDQWHALRSL